MGKKLKKQLLGIVTILAIIVLAIAIDKLQIIDKNESLTQDQTQKETQIDSNINTTLYEVIRVVDGDTFIISYNGKDERVRLIGVDTPESVHPDEEKNTEFGDKVSSYSKEMLQGKQVALEFDIDKKDQYDRLLAYVYLDGQMYNKILLEKGYAQVSTYPPNVKYVDEFIDIQKEARVSKVGMWAD